MQTASRAAQKGPADRHFSAACRGRSHDWDATQSPVLFDGEINGQKRKLVAQASRNGYFFVLDRTNGKLLSAKPFVPVTWASSIDMSTGRPVENPSARYKEQVDLQVPGTLGAHNWHPMSYNPQTGLVYLPAQGVPLNLTPEKTLTQNAATPSRM